jgi:hypothetical protein
LIRGRSCFSIGCAKSWAQLMSDVASPRWPLEAHPRYDEGQAYRQRVAERALTQFKDASWRPNAVSEACKIFERFSSTPSTGEELSPQAMVDAFVTAHLIPADEAEIAATTDNSAFGALIGEAAALFLSRNTDRIAWNLVHQVLFEFNGMLASLRMYLHSIFQSDQDFRGRFNTLADTIVSDHLRDPTLATRGNDKDTLPSLFEDWRKAPKLRNIWSGLREMRHSYLPSELGVLSYIYLVLDVRRLAELLDRLDNPYQTWAVLGPFSLGLGEKFTLWVDLFKHSSPSFGDDGSWNGRSLEPLLLVIAQDALQMARLPKDAADDLVSARQEEFNSLTTEISRIISEKSHGSALALRWGAWLFWLSMNETNDQPVPLDLRQPTRPFWRMLEAMAHSDAAKFWNSISVPDAFPEEVLCLLAAKILAADDGRNSTLPSAEPLYDCLPDAPEAFLGEAGRRMRDISRMFSIYGAARPDGLKYRILSVLFFQGSPASQYRDLWERTLTLRELAEHWQSGEQDDGRMDAKQVLSMVLAIGLSMLDRYAAPSLITDQSSPREPKQFGEFFALVYDSLREVQAIELFNQPLWSIFYMHLLVRRALYENTYVGDISFTAPLSPDTEPTLSTMLTNIAGVTPIFFDGLDTLIRNRVPVERIAIALQSAGVDLAKIVSSARELNAIDERKLFRIEAAGQIAAKMIEP